MTGFDQQLRSAVGRIETDATGVRAPADLTRRIVHRRRAAYVFAAGASAVVVGVAAVGAAALGNPRDEVPLIPAQQSPAPGTYIEFVPGSDVGLGYPGAAALCSGGVPESTSDDYSVTIADPQVKITNDADGFSSKGLEIDLTAAATAPNRVLNVTTMWIIERDGEPWAVVAGDEEVVDGTNSWPVTAPAPGATSTIWTMPWTTELCHDAPWGGTRIPGEYTARPVVRLHTDATAVASAELHNRRIGTDSVEWLGYRPQPGSWDCEYGYEQAPYGKSATCDPDLFVTDAGTILVPKPDGIDISDFTATVVGPEVIIEVTGPLPSDTYDDRGPADLEAASLALPLECGMTFDTAESSPTIGIAGRGSRSNRWQSPFYAYAVMAPENDGMVVFDADWRGVLTAYDYEAQENYVLGTGPVTFTEDAVSFDRFHGPTLVEASFDRQPDWCQSELPLFADSPGSMYIEGVALFIPDDGEPFREWIRIEIW